MRNMKLYEKLRDGLQKPINKKEVWFVIIAGLLIGTVFCFGMPYWQGGIDKKDTLTATGVFDGYKVWYTKHMNISVITLQFHDRDTLDIDSSCIDDNLVENLKKIKPGTRVDMLLHPRGNYVMQLSTDEMEILSFETSRKYLVGETTAFVCLGAFLYLAVGFCIIKLVRKEVY